MVPFRGDKGFYWTAAWQKAPHRYFPAGRTIQAFKIMTANPSTTMWSVVEKKWGDMFTHSVFSRDKEYVAQQD